MVHLFWQHGGAIYLLVCVADFIPAWNKNLHDLQVVLSLAVHTCEVLNVN